MTRLGQWLWVLSWVFLSELKVRHCSIVPSAVLLMILWVVPSAGLLVGSSAAEQVVGAQLQVLKGLLVQVRVAVVLPDSMGLSDSLGWSDLTHSLRTCWSLLSIGP